MAYSYIAQFSVVFIGWMIYKQVRNRMQWRSLKKWGEQYGCGDPPILPNKLPSGIERFGNLLTGFKSRQSFLQLHLICNPSLLSD